MILCQAYKKDPDLYRFVRSLDTLEDVLGTKSSVILRTDAEFFGFFEKQIICISCSNFSPLLSLGFYDPSTALWVCLLVLYLTSNVQIVPADQRAMVFRFGALVHQGTRKQSKDRD